MRGRAQTVGVLMTDIQASTAMLRDLGDDYGPLLEWHHDTVRSAVAGHQGAELTNAGDGVTFLLPTADGAVAAALQLQDRMQSALVRVRAAVHLGGVVLTSAGLVG